MKLYIIFIFKKYIKTLNSAIQLMVDLDSSWARKPAKLCNKLLHFESQF